MIFYEIELLNVPVIHFACHVKSRNYHNSFPHTPQELEISICREGRILFEHASGFQEIVYPGMLSPILSDMHCKTTVYQDPLQRHTTVGAQVSYHAIRHDSQTLSDPAQFILEIRRSGKILIPYQIYLEHQESDILQSMERIIRLHNTPNLGSRIDILSEWFHLMSKLTNIVLQKLDNSNLSCTPSERACVEKAIRYITEHYDRKLSVRQIADHIGISESYLHRTFRKVQKTSVLDFCNQYRIETAISLIRHKDMTLKQAGYQVGIEDPSYMSRLFKKVKGVSCHEFFKEKLSV